MLLDAGVPVLFIICTSLVSPSPPLSLLRGFHATSQAMCDSLDHVAEERFPFALTFFEALVRTSEGRLGPLALQRAFLGLSFLCSYACSSKGWVQAGLGDRGPLRDSDPALRTLKNLLKLVCRQV